jgi:hypothetical protein
MHVALDQLGGPIGKSQAQRPQHSGSSTCLTLIVSACCAALTIYIGALGVAGFALP